MTGHGEYKAETLMIEISCLDAEDTIHGTFALQGHTITCCKQLPACMNISIICTHDKPITQHEQFLTSN
jgi:hypothetical protein